MHIESCITCQALCIFSPFNYFVPFSYVPQFSTSVLDTVVAAGDVLSFNYNVKPHDSFEPREITLTVVVHYKDDSEGIYYDAAFNASIQIVYPVDSGETSTFTYVVLIAIIGAVYYFVQKKNAGKVTF